MYKNKRRILISAILGGLLVMTGCSGTTNGGSGDDGTDPGGEVTKVVVNQSAHSLSAALMYVAEDLGYFKDQNIDVSFVDTGSGLKSITPLIQGSSQFCACIFSHPLAAQASGAGTFKVLATLQTGYDLKIALQKDIADQLGITSQSPLNDRINALHGLNIGITEVGASTDYVTRLVLRQGGLDPDQDVKLTALGSPDTMPAALAAKRIDAFVMAPPVPEQAVSAGDAVLLIDVAKDDIEGLSNAFYMGLTTTDSYLEDHRDIAKRIYSALAKSASYIASSPHDAKKLLKEKQFPELSQESFDVSFESLHSLWPSDPALQRSDVEAAISLANEYSDTPVNVSYEDIADESIAK